MSRESDSSSAGFRGRGGAAYPSGTPPYGTERYPSREPAQDVPDTPEGLERPGTERGAVPPPQEPRTETTLTTRIKINIPGSRPIPPVVVRTPVEEQSSASEGADASDPAASDAEGASAAPGAADEGAETSSPKEGGAERTSDWFVPRKGPIAPPAEPEPTTPPGGTPAFGTDLSTDFGPGGATGPQSPYLPGSQAPFEETGEYALGDRNGFEGGGHTPTFGQGTDAPGAPTSGPASGEMPLPPVFQQMAPPAFTDPPHGSRADAVHDPLHPAGDDLDLAPGADEPATAYEAGDTLVGGVPAVPSAERETDPAEPGEENSFPVPAPLSSEPASERTARPKKKGRSKLVLAGAAVAVVASVAYGAGLLLDHADVPNGTRVLGVDIGGMARESAVQKLDTSLESRNNGPLKVLVGGEEQQLKPSAAGLAIDVETTVRNASGRDYNPVSVIGSLFGATREAEPEITVDEEKLAAALKSLPGSGNDGAEAGAIRFREGKPLVVQAREGLDIDRSVAAVAAAYRERADGGPVTALRLPTTVPQPAVDREEIDRAMREFADPAMSGLVTVQTDPLHTVSFSPENSLPKFLSMKPVNGRLVEHFDRKALKELYGGVFDGVLIERGDGSRTPVTPEDVIQAMRGALVETDPAARVAVIPTNPS
ncbi:hypothetical protein [Streptomyces sp. TP-A0874]|uniref:hypothetical protein n=1 Tax=Streptomyces sp. TP-A0874 TaxID=549819 RepID=UPI000853C41C|nr:hypothetical protein [Streptomyces sp. TP-A0874]